MKIVVCIKQIQQTYARTGMDPELNFLSPDDRIQRVNPYDEAALEVALKIKDRDPQTDITLLTLGPVTAEAELRRCLALGADRLYRIDAPASGDSGTKARMLTNLISQIDADLVLCGKVSLDRQNGQVGAFMAQFLNRPYVGAILDLEAGFDDGTVRVKRSCGRGVREEIRCALPAVFSVDLGASAARTPQYTHRLRAAGAPIRRFAALPIAETPRVRVSKVYPPHPRTKHTPTPDHHLGAFDRIEHLLAGSRVEKKGQVLTGSPASQVEAVLSFLEERGCMPPQETPPETDKPGTD